MKKTSGLTVRQHERAGIQVPMEFHVCKEHGVQVRFSPQSNSPDHHVISATAVDISPGGVGMECRNFVPRMCEGVIRITSGGEVVLEQRAKVRRIFLIGREPKYQIGLAFINPPDDIERRISEITAQFEGEALGKVGPARA